MRTLRLNPFALSAAAVIAGAVGATLFVSSLVSAAPPEVITQPATTITTTDATLNATNGDTDATGSAFWVSTSTFTPMSSASPVLPADVYSTGDLGPVASSTAFSAQLSSATIPAGLLPITSGTTYYYSAWTNVGGTWYPGAVMSFTTLPDAPTLTSISPATSTTAGGTVVTITGTNFTGATAVNFGSTTATVFTVNSDTSITATAPATTTAGMVDVTVTTPGGTTATSAGSEFTYTSAVVLAPTISNITVTNLGSTTATVNWTTDLPSSGQVMYGTTTSYGSSSTFNGTASTTHSAMLTGLSEGTLYHFTVSSGNTTGTTTSSDQTFVTMSTGSSTPLAVTSIDSIDTTAVADGSFENGWKWMMHFTVPDNEDAFRIQFSSWSMVGTPSTTFTSANNVRISSAQSSNASTTSSGMIVSGNNTYSGWMYVNGDTSTSTPGRQIDVLVEVRIPVGTTPGSYSSSFVANTTPSTATSTTI